MFPPRSQQMEYYLRMMRKGHRPLVLCGPSGSGKSTLIKLLLDKYPQLFKLIVSHTTRAPRPDEKDGIHYYFTNKKKMQEQIKNGEFIETATFGGNLYGTSKQAIENVLKDGSICILDIDIQGVKQVKCTSDFRPVYVFVKPPSIVELERRLRNRKTETEESLKRRLSLAKTEIEYGETPGNFDIIIENDDIEKAFETLTKFLVNLYARSDEVTS